MMKLEQSAKLLNKFYAGETTLEEESQLRQEMLNSDGENPEKDYFEYTLAQKKIPENIEADISLFIDEKINKKRISVRRIYSFVSVAASLLIFFSVFHEIKKSKNQKMEDNFFLMEQALFQVSETLKPDIQEDMVVLWVDNNVEIIIN